MAFWRRFRLDRYVIAELRGPLLLGLGGFTFVLLVQYLFVLARQTIERSVPFHLVLGFVLAELPRLLVFTLPMAALLAVLVAIGRMASQSELIALRACGVTPRRLFRPVLAMGFALTALSLWASHYLLPSGKQHERELVQEMIRVREPAREIDPGVFYNGLPGSVFYARSAVESAEGRVFEGIFLQREGQSGLSELIVAQRGRPVFDRETGRISLLLDDGEWHSFKPDEPDTYHRVVFKHHTLSFPPEASFAALSRKVKEDPQALPGAKLPALIRSLEQQVRTATDAGKKIGAEHRLKMARMDLHRRFTLPLAIVVFCFAAFPLAARSRRGGRFAGLGQALAIIFVYYVVFSTAWGLSEQGKLSPWVGPWLPNVVTFVFGVFMWISQSRAERGIHGFRRRRAPAPPAAAAAPMKTAPVPARIGPLAVWRRFGVSRLDGYVARACARMFVAVTLVLLVLVVTLEFKGAVDEVDPNAHGFPWALVVRYVALAVPLQLRYLVPIAALVGASIALSGFARGGELVAMKATGIGPVRIAAPVLVLGLGVCALQGAVQEFLAPTAAREARTTLDRIQGRASAGEAESGRRWVVGQSDHLWAYLDIDSASKSLAAPGVVVVDLPHAHVKERIESSRAVIEGGRWSFRNGWRRTFGSDGAEEYTALSSFPSPFVESPDVFGAVRSGIVIGGALADQMSIADLRRHVDRMARAGYDAAALVVDLHQKIVTPLLPLVLLLVGVPLMVSGWARRGSLAGFGYSLVIIFAFWMAWAATTSLGRTRMLEPILATWSAPLLVAAWGAWRLGRAR